eukprot:m.110328 g.110328  ORF g.110328 m.110328 type:complete len:222 (+) comp14326_c0_seq9:2179-2844(+)
MSGQLAHHSLSNQSPALLLGPQACGKTSLLFDQCLQSDTETIFICQYREELEKHLPRLRTEFGGQVPPERLAKVKIMYAATVDDLMLCLFRIHCQKEIPSVVAIDGLELFAMQADESTLARLCATIHDTWLFLLKHSPEATVIASATRAHIPQAKLSIFLRYLRALTIQPRERESPRDGTAFVILPGNVTEERLAASSAKIHSPLFRFFLYPESIALLPAP